MKDSNEITLADLSGEDEVMTAEIVSTPEDFQEMSLSVLNANKKALASIKTQVMLTLDQKKLAEAEKLISGIENIGEIFADKEIMKKIKANVKTTMDIKFLAEAQAKMIDSSQKLSRLDSIDGQGTAAKISLAVQFEGASGQKVQTVIHAEG